MVVACMYVNLCVIDYCANLPPKITARNPRRGICSERVCESGLPGAAA
jgi:hypothetical protein